MFGYITINKPELKIKDYEMYHAYYCGVCEGLKPYGISGRLTLSFDLTFIAMLLTGLYEPREQESLRRCAMHPMTKHPRRVNPYTRYAADMNLLLAYYNALDDWQDDRALKSGALSLTVKRDAKKVAGQYPRQAAAIRTYISALAQCQQSGCADLDQAAGLTGTMFAEICTCEEDLWADTLRKVGFYLGKFIYLMDAWEDVKKDRESGSYNPWIASGHEEDRDYAVSVMNMMMSECARAFERLPIVEHAEILRNIIYSGVWMKLEAMEAKAADLAAKTRA